MKYLLTILVIVALGYGAWKLLETNPNASVPQAVISEGPSVTPPTENPPAIPAPTANTNTAKKVDNANVTVSFTGFGPGKKHIGTFSDVRSNLTLNAQNSLAGSIAIGMNSLTTDTEGVTKDLKTERFFDVIKYPTAMFTVIESNIFPQCDSTDLCVPMIKGNFNIHGVTKEVSFPITKIDTSYTTEFTLNMKDFGINQTFANETVQLTVVLPIQ